MSNIDKQAKSVIRELIEDARNRRHGKLVITANEMEALLDELEDSERLRLKFQDANCELCQKLEAAERRIAELSHHLQCAHAFVEHTEAFGHAASNGILCCGDAQWNIDESKSALASAGKGE